MASISSCHMLTYLHLARLAGFAVESYEDQAVGETAKNERGVPWIATVVLAPRIVYRGDARPSPEEEQRLHDQSHEQCFVSQSIKTEVTVTRSDAV